MKEKENKGWVYDRWSIVFTIMVIAVIVSILLISKNKVKYSWVPVGFSVVPLAITAMSSGRIRKNDYTGEILYKGENDCKFTAEPKTKIDGLRIQDKIYKTANGTDIKIDKTGSVKPVGFGSKMINSLSGGGYLNEAPDECWK